MHVLQEDLQPKLHHVLPNIKLCHVNALICIYIHTWHVHILTINYCLPIFLVAIKGITAPALGPVGRHDRESDQAEGKFTNPNPQRHHLQIPPAPHPPRHRRRRNRPPIQRLRQGRQPLLPYRPAEDGHRRRVPGREVRIPMSPPVWRRRGRRDQRALRVLVDGGRLGDSRVSLLRGGSWRGIGRGVWGIAKLGAERGVEAQRGVGRLRVSRHRRRR